MQTRENFCEVFALKFASFVHKIVRCYLSVVQAFLSFAAPPSFFCDLPKCERKSVEKPTLQSPCTFINVKTLEAALQLN